MKSLKESLGFKSSSAYIDSVPKSVIECQSYKEHEKLQILWIEIMKSEESLLKLSFETQKFSSLIKEIQLLEEKLYKSLEDANLGKQSEDFNDILDEYLSLVVENKLNSDLAHQISREVTSSAPEQYTALFEQLNNFKKKRDWLVGEIQKCQEKYDKLKLKGKRTTDVTVEKDRYTKMFKEANQRLIDETTEFHNLRMDLLSACLQASVRNQINYYGGVTGNYSNQIRISRTPPKSDPEYARQMDSYLKNISKLTIVDE